MLPGVTMIKHDCPACDGHGALSCGGGDENGPSEREHVCDECHGTGQVDAICDCCGARTEVSDDAGTWVCAECAAKFAEEAAEAEAAQ